MVRLPSHPSRIGGFVVRELRFDYFLSDDVFPRCNKTGKYPTLVPARDADEPPWRNSHSFLLLCLGKVSTFVNGSFFETPGHMGFTCKAQQNVSLSDSVILGVSSLHLEAFRNTTSTDFIDEGIHSVN